MTKGRRNTRFAVRLAETLIILAFFSMDCTLEAKPAAAISETGVVDYLSQFGYLSVVNQRSKAIMSGEALSEAISNFQSFVGLNVTGNMDVETTRLMSLPRCGVKDKVRTSLGGRSRRWAAFGSPWPVKNLTYKISKYPSSTLDEATVEGEIARALAVWSEYTDLTFSPSSGQVDIEIRFEVGDHGDNNPFNGPGAPGQPNELAHAYSPGPGMGGDAHFDDGEPWTVNTYEGINLFQVAAHEFGHSLGLDHSQIASALMAPIYRSYEPNFKLHTDDIEGIQAIYGPKTIRDPESGYQPKVEVSDLCKDPQVDTIFSTAEGHIYVFKGNHYWRLTMDGIAAGYPKLIATGWNGLPDKIDAAFAYNEKTYFFKGSQYWVFVNEQMDGGYPRKISTDFPGIPDNIGAVTEVSGTGRIYFYKGSKFWKFNPAQHTFVSTASPKPVSDWPGLPENVDAGFSYNGYTYFFKDAAYYRYDEKTYSMDPANPYEAVSDWFGCLVESNEVSNSDRWQIFFP